MSIYFLRHNDLIKIGYSSNVADRARSLLTAVPGDAQFLGYMPGDRETEAHLHLIFDAQRFSGEWFAVSDDLLAIIRILAFADLPDRPIGTPRAPRGEKDREWRELSRRVRMAAAYRWPDLEHHARRSELTKLLGWGARRVKSLYQAEPGLTLRQSEAEDLNQLLMADAETMSPTTKTPPTSPTKRPQASDD